jgi:hypothetical protein
MAVIVLTVATPAAQRADDAAAQRNGMNGTGSDRGESAQCFHNPSMVAVDDAVI